MVVNEYYVSRVRSESPYDTDVLKKLHQAQGIGQAQVYLPSATKQI